MLILKSNDGANVAVAIETIPEGAQISAGADNITAVTKIPAGHKIALRDLQEGEPDFMIWQSLSRALHSDVLQKCAAGSTYYACS